VALAYDRLGRQKTVSDAVGSRTLSYNSSLKLESESITGIYNKVIGRSYETSGVTGRYLGVSVGTEYSVGYGYDSYGRVNSLSSGPDNFTYAYLENSDLLASVTCPNTITSTNSYEAKRDLLTSVENKYNTSTVSKYAYSYDAIGRRQNVVNTGSAFGLSNYTAWAYNNRSELASARKYTGVNVGVTSSPVTTYNYAFNYDNIGNRSTSTTYESGSAVTTTYTSNNLNQYTATANPAQSPTYDYDGNMTSCNGWAFTWDAENRLVKAVNASRLIEFKYDYMSRRIEKKVTDAGTVSKHLRFVYDGFKMIEELDAANSNAVRRKFVWDGERPLSMSDADGVFYYVCDANKNVTEMLDSSGNVRAHYEYDPYGKIILQTGDKANDNPIRFSSEYFDSETSLVYYNYRYYNPSLGRWLSKDPIEEKDGWNLYEFVKNSPVRLIDILGRESADIQQEAIKAMKSINKASTLLNREMCGMICKKCVNGKQKYFKTGPVIGTMKSCYPSQAPCPPKSESVAYYHSHGKTNPDYLDDAFSFNDIAYTKSKIRAYMVTPSGDLNEFDPQSYKFNTIGPDRLYVPRETSSYTKFEFE